MAKKSSYQRLKEKIASLDKEKAEYCRALKMSIQGTMDSHELFVFKTRFKMEDEFEAAVWFGEPCSLKKGDLVKFNGRLHKVIKRK